MIGDSPFAPSSAGSATPPSSISVANSETGEIKQLEPEYPRRPSEPDYTIGDSLTAFSSAGSAPPTSLMNLASSVSGEIKQLEPEYPWRRGKPDCPMSDASSLSSVSITTPPSENKRRIKKKSIVALTGDPSSDVSTAPPANSETGEKQPELEYPLRPGKSDCSYYVKFGSCRYGKNCWFNHPLYMRGGFQRDNWVGKNSTRASNSSEYNKQYFYDQACNYNRHEGKTKVKQVKLNFLGLPLRPGAILCSYYMNRGTCKFGTNCKFHHPDPESEDTNLNASQHTTQGISQTNRSTKHVQQALNGHSVPLVTSPTIGTSEVIPTQGFNLCPEWNGYQMDENKQGKSDWDPSTTKVFL